MRGDVGYTQYQLLSALATQRRSEESRRRLLTLERKFGAPLQESQGPPYVGILVSSPISQKAADAMRDEDWLRAIAKHSSSSLSQELQRVSRLHPDRFVKLMQRMPPSTDPGYFVAVLMGIANEQVPQEIALAACEIADRMDEKSFGQMIVYCIGKTSANNPLPAAISLLAKYTGPAFTDDIRNSALINLGNLLRADQTKGLVALTSLELAAENVPRNVRYALCYCLLPLFHTPLQADVIRLFEPMWSTDPWLPPDHQVENFLRRGVALETRAFLPVVETLLEGQEPETRAIQPANLRSVLLLAALTPSSPPSLWPATNLSERAWLRCVRQTSDMISSATIVSATSLHYSAILRARSATPLQSVSEFSKETTSHPSGISSRHF